MHIVYILIFLAALGWILYNWRQKADLKIPITVAAGTLILNIFPAISYLLLLGALGWLGFSFYIKMPVIAAVAALVLVATMPSDNTGGGNGIRISGNASRRDFSSEAKVKAYFESNLERRYPDPIPCSVLVSPIKFDLMTPDRPRMDGFSVLAVAYINKAYPASFQFLVARDGRIYGGDGRVHDDELKLFN